ncbi:MAG: hypothetical protein Q9209_000567 [Squamulea sp. 1 TL-2023]
MYLPVDTCPTGTLRLSAIPFEEYKGDPSSTDKLRNISRGLARFRQKRESKGVHGRSFQAAFSRFGEVGRKDLDASGFLSLPYLYLDEISDARGPRSSTSHRPKTLLQHHYRFDEYALHNEEPLVSVKPSRRIPGFKACPLTVLVDELWGLCLDEHTVITASRAPAQDLWPSIDSPPPPKVVDKSLNLETTPLPSSLINALKGYFGSSLVIHSTLASKAEITARSLEKGCEYVLNVSNQLLPRDTSCATNASWFFWQRPEVPSRLDMVQVQDLNMLLCHVASPYSPTRNDEIFHRLHGVDTPHLSRILDHVADWTLTEQSLVAQGQMLSYELTDCLESLWADAIHLFLNLPKETGQRQSKSYWKRFCEQCGSISTLVLNWKTSLNDDLLVSPPGDGDIYQDLEQDLHTHLAQLNIERRYLWSHRSVSKMLDFLEDIDSAPGNLSRHCLMHAFQRAAPFRAPGEATIAVQSYSRRMSHLAWSSRRYPSKALLHDISRTCEELEVMKGVIKSQQKIHSRIIDAIDQRLEETKGGKHNHHRSQGHKRPKDATERFFIARSAWLKTVKVLEDIEQLQGEGKRLAEQTVQLVDIKVEDQGKAVMVFTIVTVIFLPLSFVSSYFGMNTRDVRNLQHGQWIFWIVGLSVTFSTVVVALLVAFRGQRWKRRWDERFLWDQERGLKVQ